ncbi:MAG TPA: hypothetical protein IAC36_03330 [Candidatus Aphodomonas merdavium]|nr:hypothetical protein [Candidatus Aphodomonas merdavium]
MKKMICAMLCIGLVLAGISCTAEELVGFSGKYSEQYIYRYTAPNGQEIYYVSNEPEDGPAAPVLEDVNFDGVEDIVIPVAIGASNFFSVFYVWNGEEYVRARWNSGSETGLPNYTLYPEEGYVVCETNDGYVGALHQRYIYRWDGTDLEVVRYAVSDLEEGSEDNIHVKVYEANYGEEGQTDTLIWEKVLTVEETANDPNAFDEEREVLWGDLIS